jgi:DNA-binding MarR family transcriptional regulator
MTGRGWVRRAAPGDDRRVVIIEVTTAGRAALDRVSRSAETHLAEVLAPLDVSTRRRLQRGLGVLYKVFAARQQSGLSSRRGHRTSGKRRPYLP